MRLTHTRTRLHVYPMPAVEHTHARLWGLIPRELLVKLKERKKEWSQPREICREAAA